MHTATKKPRLHSDYFAVSSHETIMILLLLHIMRLRISTQSLLWRQQSSETTKKQSPFCLGAVAFRRLNSSLLFTSSFHRDKRDFLPFVCNSAGWCRRESQGCFLKKKPFFCHETSGADTHQHRKMGLFIRSWRWNLWNAEKKMWRSTNFASWN